MRSRGSGPSSSEVFAAPGSAAGSSGGASFYSEKAGAALAQAVIAEFEHAIDLLLQFPGLGAAWRHGKRRVLMRRFPYSVIDSVEGDEIRILAVAHHSRRPGYWRARK